MIQLHATPFVTGIVLSLLASGLIALPDEFTALSDKFGNATTLAGVPHATTTNPDGSGINFWTPNYEGADATTASLSNPHMAAADAFGNI